MIVSVTVTLDWCVELEVPDNFELTQESIQDLIDRNRWGFDFQDGGMSIARIDCEVNGLKFGVD